MENFAETNCTVNFQGREFTAGGAYIVGDHALVYIIKGQAKDWHGKKLGTVRVTSTWRAYPPRSYSRMWYTMTAVRVTMLDGSVWYGRYSSDWSQACKLRRAKG